MSETVQNLLLVQVLIPFVSLRFLCCSSEAEMWDWVTSFLKAQVSLRVLLRTEPEPVTADPLCLSEHGPGSSRAAAPLLL